MGKMLFDNVLIEEFREPGLVEVIGENSKDIAKGIVKSVGLGQSYGLPKFEETTVKENDIIYFLKEMAYKVKIENKEYYIVKERDVLMIIGKAGNQETSANIN